MSKMHEQKTNERAEFFLKRGNKRAACSTQRVCKVDEWNTGGERPGPAQDGPGYRDYLVIT